MLLIWHKLRCKRAWLHRLRLRRLRAKSTLLCRESRRGGRLCTKRLCSEAGLRSKWCGCGKGAAAELLAERVAGAGLPIRRVRTKRRRLDASELCRKLLLLKLLLLLHLLLLVLLELLLILLLLKLLLLPLLLFLLQPLHLFLKLLLPLLFLKLLLLLTLHLLL